MCSARAHHTWIRPVTKPLHTTLLRIPTVPKVVYCLRGGPPFSLTRFLRASIITFIHLCPLHLKKQSNHRIYL